MKSLIQIEKDRKFYHSFKNQKTVHRSSLFAPKIENCDTIITFLNHFYLKRKYKSVACKISSISNTGELINTTTFDVIGTRVYLINLDKILYSKKIINNYLIEFFSNKNLFIPFPAVMINHLGKGFCNMVHSYNRTLNDVFEDDKIGRHNVKEAAIDIIDDKSYSSFFHFATGNYPLKANIDFEYISNEKKLKKSLQINMPRLNHKRISLDKIFGKKYLKSNGVIKIQQPKQRLFYGRVLAGIENIKTKQFTCNHSFYDSSNVKEYMNNSYSFNTYPFFSEFLNKIIMYPIMSPCNLEMFISFKKNNKIFKSNTFKINSSSKKPLEISINNIVDVLQIKDVTAFSFNVFSKNSKIPTRVPHQLIYGSLDKKTNLNTSINVVLVNHSIFVPKNKKGYCWGQILVCKNYIFKLGICFKDSNNNTEDKIKLKFYSQNGLECTYQRKCKPGSAIIVDNDTLNFNPKNKINFLWFTATCNRHDLIAFTFHLHKKYKIASGDHCF